jgi:hypothetical protein
MERPSGESYFLVAVLGLISILAGCGSSGTSAPPVTPKPPVTASSLDLTVQLAGAQTGTVSSTPAGIDCGQTCSATFQSGTVTLAASPFSGSNFTGWSGACSGTGTCTISSGGTQTVTANFSATLQSINHIVFMVQENRSFVSSPAENGADFAGLGRNQ